MDGFLIFKLYFLYFRCVSGMDSYAQLNEEVFKHLCNLAIDKVNDKAQRRKAGSEEELEEGDVQSGEDIETLPKTVIGPVPSRVVILQLSHLYPPSLMDCFILFLAQVFMVMLIFFAMLLKSSIIFIVDNDRFFIYLLYGNLLHESTIFITAFCISMQILFDCMR
uniref:Uncharacterized protein n=1 Tax=Heterorhabditis bacteriophora TaxID=37862 RepID=A0A1I7WT21_HETBA